MCEFQCYNFRVSVCEVGVAEMHAAALRALLSSVLAALVAGQRLPFLTQVGCVSV